MELGALFQTIGRGLLLVRTAGAGFTQTARGLSTAATRTSAGLYVATLNTATPGATAKSVLTCLGATGAYGTVTHTSDTVKTIATFINTAGVSTATDVDFDWTIEQVD